MAGAPLVHCQTPLPARGSTLRLLREAGLSDVAVAAVVCGAVGFDLYVQERILDPGTWLGCSLGLLIPVYVCACMCMYVYVCVCMCMYVYVYVCVCMCMNVYECVCMCMYVS